MNKIPLAESVLNRIMNFADELEAPPTADPAPLGAQIDTALAAPPAELPAVPGMEEALVTKGLRL
jgi:hypothetical protein